jgi:AMP-polyphosphate phosphotransferase
VKKTATSKRRKSVSAASARSFERKLNQVRDGLLQAQSELRQSKAHALAVIITGVPTAGRSEAVNEVLEWLDPKHVWVHALDPNDPATRHRPVLWPYWIRVPARGQMAIFFEGWYDTPVSQALHKPKKAAQQEARTAERIRRLESFLAANAVRVVKVHFTVDRATQQHRLQQLQANELTRWRITPHDVWLANHYDKVKRTWQHWGELTEQPCARWHGIDGHDANTRALELGRLMLAELQRPEAAGPSSAVRTPVSSVVATAPVAAVAASDEDYDKELPRLQGELALGTRKKRFRKTGLVLAFEGMDAAGKGGAIRRITQALDARQYRVVPVAAPTPEELLRPYLWRFWREVPRRGEIVIFDRSWYGRVLVERVRGFTPLADWKRAYDEIREFELELHETGLSVRKFWLSVSEEEQLKRFKARESDPLKRFKVDPEDWTNRKHFADYQAAAREMIERTHTSEAPWTAIDADDKKAARLQVMRTVMAALRAQ